MTIISVSLSDKMAEKLTTLQNKLKCSGRSELVRVALNFLIEESDSLPVDGVQDAIIIVVHGDKLSFTAASHEYEQIIKTHIHHHLKDNTCSELLLLRGDINDIREIYNQLRRDKKIRMVKLFFV